MKEKIISQIKNMKKEQMIIFLLLLGLVVVISIPTKKGTQKTDNNAADGLSPVEAQDPLSSGSEQQKLEELLENTLRKVEGVGEVAVAVTMESTGEKIVEKDIPSNDSNTTQEDSQGGKQKSTVQSSEEATVYTKDNAGNQVPYVISETAPKIRGVIVVAKGGDNPVIVQQIQEAVMALFHVDAHKIKVMKMK